MVSTFPNGGATIAARRQAEALRSIGQDCDMVSIQDYWDISEIHITQDRNEISINVPSSAWSYSRRITTAYCNENRTSISNTWFSFWPCETFLDDALLEICLRYDVIHFHWISQMVSTRLLAKLNAYGRRILFTGHDMNHFTGGCHYSAGCEQYISGCNECPQLIADPLKLVSNSFQKKYSALAALSTTWLFPSEWLADTFRQSKLNDQDNSAACKVLYNCIDIERFFYLAKVERDNQRLMFGFAPEEMVYVAGASDNTELRKGFEYLEVGIQHLAADFNKHHVLGKQCVIVTFGRGTPMFVIDTPFIRHLHLGVVDENKVISLLQVSDLLIFPSVEENFSNTILESLLCGCPVLAFRIGGIPDIVIHDTNGWIVDYVSHQDFSNTLVSISELNRLKTMHLSTQCWRDQYAYLYSYQYIAQELMLVYKNTSDITRRRNFKLNTDLIHLQIPYTSLFKSVVANDANSHSMLAVNLAKHIATATEESLRRNDNNTNLTIPAIYSGFTDMVDYESIGRVSWLLKDGYIIFKARHNVRPALMLGIPNKEWVPALLESALLKLTATINGTPIKVSCLEPIAGGSQIYVWVVVQPDILLFESYNTIKLSFSESSVPESNDPRGLCILCTNFTLFNISTIASSQEVFSVSDYHMCSALALKAAQSHYLWQDWTEETNSSAVLRNDMETWMDLIGPPKSNMGLHS
jgi:glycosyltransferase involved in cell wall biosynthesis